MKFATKYAALMIVALFLAGIVFLVLAGSGVPTYEFVGNTITHSLWVTDEGLIGLALLSPILPLAIFVIASAK